MFLLFPVKRDGNFLNTFWQLWDSECSNTRSWAKVCFWVDLFRSTLPYPLVGRASGESVSTQVSLQQKFLMVRKPSDWFILSLEKTVPASARSVRRRAGAHSVVWCCCCVAVGVFPLVFYAVRVQRQGAVVQSWGGKEIFLFLWLIIKIKSKIVFSVHFGF